MKQQNNIIPLGEVNLSNNFLFGEVMWDEATSKDVLEIILGVEIKKVIIVNKEQHMDISQRYKGIRIDVYIRDEENTVYNIEMQVENRYNIIKRSRHYQGVIDTKQLPAGSIDYNKLNNSYIIFICEFDLFEKGWYFYSFEERCNEDLNLKLNDGTKKIFLNTKGNNYNGEPQELLEFLEYVKDTNHPKEFHSNRMKRLVKRVEEVRKDEDYTKKAKAQLKSQRNATYQKKR